MVEFRDGKTNSRAAHQNDGTLSGAVFGDAKRDRQDHKDKETPKPHVQPQDGGRKPHPDFTPPAPQPKENPKPRVVVPTDTMPTVRIPGRDQTPRVQPTDTTPKVPHPRDQFPNFPNIPQPKTDLRPHPDRPNPAGPRPGDNVTPRVDFPDFKPQRRTSPDTKPPADRNRPGVTPAFPFNPGGDSTPTKQPTLRPDNNPTLRPDNPTIKPNVRPATPSPYDFRPNERQDGKPRIPHVTPRTDVPAVQPTIQPPADTPRVNPGGVQPPADTRIDPGAVQPRTDVQPQPSTVGPQFRPQKPNVINNIVQDLLIGPQYGPGYYPGGGGYNPGFYPQRPNTPGAILNDVVNDLINPGGINPNYDPRLDPRNPSYDPRFDPRCDPRSPSYDPQFDPRLDPRNPSYDPRLDPRLDPRSPSYDPRMDTRNPNYDPRFDPRNDPRYNPGYTPGFDTRYPQNPNTPAQRIIGDVIGDLLGARRPGYNPGVYNPNYPQPDCAPGYGPQGYNFPQRFPGGRFPQNGQVRDFIRQGLGNLRNNPQALDGLMNGLGGLLGGAQFNIDRERGELNLAMDFTKAYDSITQKQGTPPNPEIRRVLAGLDSINLSADAMNLNWKGEQLVSLGDQANGPGKDLRLLLGGGTNRTSFQIQSNETRLNLSNIQGLEAVDPQGKRLRVHMIDLDTSDPAGPKGSITIDNPMPKPAQLPAGVQWPEQVALPIPMNGPQQKQMADALPGMIRTINSMRNAAKSGDLSQLTGNLNPGDLANIIGMLKGPKPQPVNPDQYRPDYPPIPQPDGRPQVPPPPEPGIPADRVIPKTPEPGIPAERVIPAPPEPGIPAEVAPKPIRSLGDVDYLDFAPAPAVTPQAEVKPAVTPIAPPPKAADTTIKPAIQPVEPGARRLSGGSMLRGNTTASLFASSLGREATPPAADKPVAPATQPIAPAAEVASVELPPAPKLVEPVTPAPVAPKAEVRPQPSTTDSAPRGGRSEELLRANGIKVPEVQKIGTERLFNMVFADADQTGPLVTGFNRALADRRFREDVSTIGSTLNRFDVDKANKSITVGLDFAKAYDTIETDRSKYKPETRQFLSGLQAVTITPEQIRLKLNGPSKLPMDGEGLKKADLWLGTANGETTFDYQTTEKSITLQAKGLQAEVTALGKKLNVYEIKIDTSSGAATATALVDTPFDKPPGVPESTWSKTMLIPLELGKTSEETAEINRRLPQTLKSLNAMRQGAQNGGMAERMGNLTKEDIIALLKFQ